MADSSPPPHDHSGRSFARTLEAVGWTFAALDVVAVAALALAAHRLGLGRGEALVLLAGGLVAGLAGMGLAGIGRILHVQVSIEAEARRTNAILTAAVRARRAARAGVAAPGAAGIQPDADTPAGPEAPPGGASPRAQALADDDPRWLEWQLLALPHGRNGRNGRTHARHGT